MKPFRFLLHLHIKDSLLYKHISIIGTVIYVNVISSDIDREIYSIYNGTLKSFL